MTKTPLESVTGAYGPSWREGVLTDHLYLAEQRGLVLHEARNGAAWIRPPEGGRAVRVVCSELVWIDTEDGRIDGRCGRPVIHGECPRHGQVM
jgi:hypothetical protein